MSSNPASSAASATTWKHHTLLKIVTQDDENALQSLLPYLAMGFGMVDTAGKENHTSAFHALRGSFDSARQKIYERKDKTPDWRDYMEIKGYGYEKVVDQYVRSLEGLSARGREDRAKELMRLSSGRDLSKEQMICLLKVANQEMKTHFQLGIVRAGFSGRYDRNTGEIEPFYVRQTRLEFPEGKMRNRPVLWIYATNRNERSQAHRILRADKESDDHYEAITVTHSEQTDYSAHMSRVEQFGVGERLESLFKKGVWRVTRDQLSEGGLGSLEGTFVREIENSEVLEDFQYVRASNGSIGFVNSGEIKAIPRPLRDAPTAETDAEWNQCMQRHKPKTQEEEDEIEARAQILKQIAEDELEDEEEEPEVLEGLTKLNLCRVIPATSRVGNWLTEDDKVMDSGDFSPGAIVLDTGERFTKQGTMRAEVVRANGEKGKIWLRCLQPLGHPFGLVDRLPHMEPFVEIPAGTSLKDLKIMYEAIHNKPPEFARDKRKRILEQLNDEEPRKRRLLKVFAMKKDSSATKADSEVAFEKQEYVLEESSDGRTHVVRDFEGIPGSLNPQDLKPVMGRAAGAWNLCLSVKKLRKSGLFLPARLKPRRQQGRGRPPRRR